MERPIVASSLTEFCLELAHRDGESDVLILCGIPKNANRQPHYHEEHGTDQVM